MHLLWLRQINLSLTLHCMSLKYYDRKVYDKRNGQICRPQKCRVKFGKNVFPKSKFALSGTISIFSRQVVEIRDSEFWSTRRNNLPFTQCGCEWLGHSGSANDCCMIISIIKRALNMKNFMFFIFIPPLFFPIYKILI